MDQYSSQQIDNITLLQKRQQYDDQEEPQEIDLKSIISKKKEIYRVEIRKKNMKRIFADTRNKILINNLQNNIQEQKRTFNSDEEKIEFVDQIIKEIQINIEILKKEANQNIAELILKQIVQIMETVVEEDESDPIYIEKVINLDIIKSILPIIEEEQFQQYIFLQQIVYNLFGSLFYTNSSVLEKFINKRVVKLLLKSLKSSETLVIQEVKLIECVIINNYKNYFQQGLFCLGNLIMGSDKLKKSVYKYGLIDELFQIYKYDKLNQDNTSSNYYGFIKDIVMVMSYFCDQHKHNSIIKKYVCIKDTKKLIEIIFDLSSKQEIFDLKDETTAIFLSKSLLDCIDVDEHFIDHFYHLQTIKGVNLIERFLNIMENCKQYNEVVIQNLTSFIINIIAGPDSYIQDLLDRNLLDIFQIIFITYRKSTKFQSEIIWGMSNICATNENMIQQVMNHQFTDLLISNYDKSLNNIQQLIMSPFMQNYINAMNTSDTSLLLSLLDGINEALHSFSDIFTADGENVIIVSLEKYNFIQMLQELQEHKEEKVYNSVTNIIKTHFQYSEQESN